MSTLSVDLSLNHFLREALLDFLDIFNYRLSPIAYIDWCDNLINIPPPLYLTFVKAGATSDLGFLLYPEPSPEHGTQ